MIVRNVVPRPPALFAVQIHARPFLRRGAIVRSMRMATSRVRYSMSVGRGRAAGSPARMVSRRQRIEGARGELHMHNPSRAHTEVLDCTATQVGAAEKGGTPPAADLLRSPGSSWRSACRSTRARGWRSCRAATRLGGAMRPCFLTAACQEALRVRLRFVARAPRCCTTRRCRARARRSPTRGAHALSSARRVMTIPSSTLLPACPFVVGASVQNAERPLCSRGPNRSAPSRAEA